MARTSRAMTVRQRRVPANPSPAFAYPDTHGACPGLCASTMGGMAGTRPAMTEEQRTGALKKSGRRRASKPRENRLGLADLEAAGGLDVQLRHFAIVGHQRITLAAPAHAARVQVKLESQGLGKL